MGEKGQKTKLIHFWLTDEDASEFSDALHEVLPDMQWRCSHPSPDQLLVHHFNTLHAALGCGRENPFFTQAFAPLALSELQFFICYRKRMTGVKDNYAPGHVYPPAIDVVDYGRMAIRWNTQDGDDATLTTLAAQLKTIWKTFQRSTLPAKVHTTGGQPLSDFRIGRRMLEIAKAEKLYLQSNGPFCLLD